MSEDPRSRAHIHNVMLNAPMIVALARVQAKYEISKSAAVLATLNEGLHSLGAISEDDYELLKKRYLLRKLRDIIEEGKTKREPSHVSVIDIERRKEQKLLEDKDSTFKNVLKDWDLDHPHKPNWRANWISEAKKYPQLPHAQKILELAQMEIT